MRFLFAQLLQVSTGSPVDSKFAVFQQRVIYLSNDVSYLRLELCGNLFCNAFNVYLQPKLDT